jgi:hypothetical protein
LFFSFATPAFRIVAPDSDLARWMRQILAILETIPGR